MKAFHVAHFLFLSTSQKMIPTPFDGNYGRYLVGHVDGFTRYAHDGVALPPDVLEKIYFKNALRLMEWRAETGNFPAADLVRGQVKRMQKGQ